MQVKVNKDGKITIPKKIRDKYNLKSGIELMIKENNGSLIITPTQTCLACGKALPRALYDKHACEECSLPEGKFIKIY